MKHIRVRSLGALAVAAGMLLFGTSASFAQCMAGGQGMGSAGTGMMGGPRMMGMGQTGTGTASAGASMMSLQQAMQMAQTVQQMRAMQFEQMRMLQAQRNRQAAQQPRNRRASNRQIANANVNPNQPAINSTQETEPNVTANPDAALPSTKNKATARSQRNRRVASNRND